MKNKESNNGNKLHYGRWFEQKNLNYLDYVSVYELLDELTIRGYTAKQIREALETGISCI
jgi:hypothetical protein